MSNINYPDVPPLPGVPALNRVGNQALAAGLTIAAELYALYLKIKNTPLKYPKKPTQTTLWGILYANDQTLAGQVDYTVDNKNKIKLKGTYALEPTSFVKFEYKGDRKIPNYPMEQGSFQSYNKVALPYEIKLTVTKSGSNTSQNDSAYIVPFIKKIQTMLDETNILTIVTPDHVYESTSLINFDYRKESNRGAVLLIAELTFQEIRVVPNPSLPTAQPQGATTTPLGQTSPNPTLTQFGNNGPVK